MFYPLYTVTFPADDAIDISVVVLRLSDLSEIAHNRFQFWGEPWNLLNYFKTLGVDFHLCHEAGDWEYFWCSTRKMEWQATY